MYTYEGKIDGATLRIGVVVSRFNSAVTERLLAGAIDGLKKNGVADSHIEVVKVPGAFEIPACAQALAVSGRFDALVCLGAVVRGDTPHFDFIAASVVNEVGRLVVQHALPMALGVLTTNTMDQALARSGSGHGNKGYEAAVTALEMANVCRELRKARDEP
jgi:6,7-dimethyl-8-ribityllumazine synthase